MELQVPQQERIEYLLTQGGFIQNKAGNQVHIRTVTEDFRQEFMILFFGAAWSAQSQEVTQRLTKFVQYCNRVKEEVKLIYIGNEQSEQELQLYLETSPLKDLPNVFNFLFNDDFALRVREELMLDSLPTVVVFDKNLEIITQEGTGELLHLDYPEMVRGVWVGLLKKQVEDKKAARK